MTRRSIYSPIAWLAGIGLFAASPLSAAEVEDKTKAAGAEPPQSVEEQVQKDIDAQAAERRKAMLQEARSALAETNAALTALDEGKTAEALDALARATGKLEILLARDPDLALAPVDVRYITQDLYGTVDDIRAAIDQVEALLDDGEVQEARALLSSLASEFVISVRNIPLAPYPDAIKAVTPLIDKGEIEEAKLALRPAEGRRGAFNTPRGRRRAA
jgi:soluble cytochrome b562